MKGNRGFQSTEIRLLAGNNAREHDLQSNTALTIRYSYYETCVSQHMFQGLLELITCPHLITFISRYSLPWISDQAPQSAVVF